MSHETFELRKKIHEPLIKFICLVLIFVLFLSLGNLIYYLKTGGFSTFLFVANNIFFILLFLFLGKAFLREKNLKLAVFSWFISITPIFSYFAVVILWTIP